MAQAPALARPGPVRFRYGGRLALDFVNTVDNRVGPPTRDDLPDYSSLASWAWQMEALDDEAALGRAASANPAAACAAHAAAIELREGLYRIFSAIIAGKPMPAADLDRLNEFAAAARSRQRLVRAGPHFQWALEGGPLDLDRPALLVALSASDLLTREDLSRLKQCPAPEGCGWLFYDESRNRSRRWCSMEQCGGAAKARRFAGRRAAPGEPGDFGRGG